MILIVILSNLKKKEKLFTNMMKEFCITKDYIDIFDLLGIMPVINENTLIYARML